MRKQTHIGGIVKNSILSLAGLYGQIACGLEACNELELVSFKNISKARILFVNVYIILNEMIVGWKHLILAQF